MNLPITGWYNLLTRTALAMIGLPDYNSYAAHRQLHHPDQPIMSEAEFLRERQEARYGGRKGRPVRCC